MDTNGIPSDSPSIGGAGDSLSRLLVNVPDLNALDVGGPACFVISIGNDAAKYDRAGRDFQTMRHLGHKSLDAFMSAHA